jgi:hypothetical protein
MKTIFRNLIALLLGVIIGAFVNEGFILMSSSVIPLPPGVDPTNLESLKANIATFPPKNFIFPFLAHAVGTLVGAFIVTKIAVNRQLPLSMIVGVLFLMGGIMMVNMLPAPMWFNVLDLVGAYLPMAWLGWNFGKKRHN